MTKLYAYLLNREQLNTMDTQPPIEDFYGQFAQKLSMSAKYPKYYKDVSHLREVDVYAVHQLFGIDDPSGALQHASKKLLLSGVRTGGKSKFHDIREARDTLNRWLELNAIQE